MPTPPAPTPLSPRATPTRVPHLRRSFIAPKVGMYNAPQPVLAVALVFAVVICSARHSERSEESPHFAFAVAFAVAVGVAVAVAVAVAFIAFAVVVAFASRYPKASALGLCPPQQKRGFSPWGMASTPSHILRTTALALITATLLTTTACSPRKPVPDPKPVPKPIPKTLTPR